MPWGWIILLGVSLAAVLTIAAAGVAWVLLHPPRWSAGRAAGAGLALDPGEAGHEFQTLTLLDSTGQPIEVWLVAGGSADGPCVVILHGWGDSKWGAMAWLNVLAPLAGCVAIYDQRGHGESPHRRCDWSAGESADLRAILSQLPLRRPCPVVLAGYSLGAATAVRTAATGQGRHAAGLLLDSPFLRPADAIAGMLRLHRLPGRLLARMAVAMAHGFCPAIASTNLQRLAHSVEQPALVIHGQTDQVIRAGDAGRVAHALPAGGLWLVAGAGHLEAAALDPRGYRQHAAELMERANRFTGEK